MIGELYLKTFYCFIIYVSIILVERYFCVFVRVIFDMTEKHSYSAPIFTGEVIFTGLETMSVSPLSPSSCLHFKLRGGKRKKRKLLIKICKNTKYIMR